jgi:glycosyltransferase involved in cell wall biosynthesis
MKFSIITVCYNSVKTIRTAMESVLRQKNVDFEYIVKDGGSTDGTLDVVKEYEPKFNGRMRWISDSDEGMYDAINLGIIISRGDIIGIMNADDFFETDHALVDVERVFGTDEKLRAVYADVRFIRQTGETDLDKLRATKTQRYYSATFWMPWMLQWGFMPPHPSVYIMRDEFFKLGAYKLCYKIAADYELLVRYLRKEELKARYLDECLVAMRAGGKSTSGWRSNLLLNQENVRANRENGYLCCLPMMFPKYLFKIWEYILPRFGLK